MNILLTGASGFVASHLLQALQRVGHSMFVCTHSKAVEPSEALNIINVNFMHMHQVDDWLPHLKGIDAVINSVGIIAENKKQTFAMLHLHAPANLFKACEIMGVKRVIQISALGADDTAVVKYHRSKKAADDILRNSSLDWFILRPSLIYGKGGKSFKFFQQLSNLPIIPLLGDGQQMLQPVHISDVVATVLRCLDSDVSSQQTIDVVSEQVISYQYWLISLRQKQSKAYFLQLPVSMVMRLSSLGKYFRLPLFNPDNLYMLQQNTIADSTALTTFLGRKPISLQEGKQLL